LDTAAISVIATSTVSILSLVLNYQVFLREQPKLRVSAFIASDLTAEVGNEIKKIDSSMLVVTITNIRRQSVTVKRIGFFKSCWLERILSKYFPDIIEEKGAILMGGKFSILAYVRNPSTGRNEPRALQPNEEVAITVELDKKSIKTLKELFLKYRKFYIEDATGRIHYLPWYSFRKVRIDLIDLAK
jgi:hypothetical protein